MISTECINVVEQQALRRGQILDPLETLMTYRTFNLFFNICVFTVYYQSLPSTALSKCGVLDEMIIYVLRFYCGFIFLTLIVSSLRYSSQVEMTVYMYNNCLWTPVWLTCYVALSYACN